MRTDEQQEIEAEVVVLQPYKVKLWEVVLLVSLFIYSACATLVFIYYAVTVSHNLWDFVGSAVLLVITCGSLYLGILNVKKYIRDRKNKC